MRLHQKAHWSAVYPNSPGSLAHWDMKCCFRGRPCVCGCGEMKYSSHKKWLSSLSSTTHYNDRPVQAETGGIVTRRHTHTHMEPKGRRSVGCGAPGPFSDSQSRRLADILHHRCKAPGGSSCRVSCRSEMTRAFGISVAFCGAQQGLQ